MNSAVSKFLVRSPHHHACLQTKEAALKGYLSVSAERRNQTEINGQLMSIVLQKLYHWLACASMGCLTLFKVLPILANPYFLDGLVCPCNGISSRVGP